MKEAGSNIRPRLSWRDRLVDLYGSGEAGTLAPRVEAMLRAHSAEALDEPLWDEHDVWLITYPDQFQRRGEPPLVTLRRFYLDHLATSYNGMHVLPFFPSSSDAGFSITDYSAVATEFGTWEDVESLAASTRLMVDAVINHASVKGEWFNRWNAGDDQFGGFFRVADPAADLTDVVRAREHPILTPVTTSRGEEWIWTTFSSDQADLDYRNPEVLLRVLEVILDYADRGARMIRLDAVGFLWKEEGSPSIHLPQTHQIVQFLRACLDEARPGTLLLTETNVPHRENLSYLGSIVPEAHAVYQFPLPPLTLDAFTTGDATKLAAFLSRFGDKPPQTTVVNFLGSHDGVGLRPAEDILSPADVDRLVHLAEDAGGLVSMRVDADGDATPYELNATWFDLIRGPSGGEDALQRHLASHAIIFAIGGIPAIYVHSLFATPSDTAAAEGPGGARAVNRAKETDIDRLETELADSSTMARMALDGMAELASLRRSSSAFHPDAAQSISTPVPSVLEVRRRVDDGSTATVLINVAGDPVELPWSSRARVVGRRTKAADDTIWLGPWGYAFAVS
jgi:sucrose phosphorylase